MHLKLQRLLSEAIEEDNYDKVKESLEKHDIDYQAGDFLVQAVNKDSPKIANLIFKRMTEEYKNSDRILHWIFCQYTQNDQQNLKDFLNNIIINQKNYEDIAQHILSKQGEYIVNSKKNATGADIPILHFVIMNNDLAVIKEFIQCATSKEVLEKVANYNCCYSKYHTKRAHTPLITATEMGNIQIMKALHKAGVNLYEEIGGISAYDMATRHPNPDVRMAFLSDEGKKYISNEIKVQNLEEKNRQIKIENSELKENCETLKHDNALLQGEISALRSLMGLQPRTQQQQSNNEQPGFSNALTQKENYENVEIETAIHNSRQQVLPSEFVGEAAARPLGFPPAYQVNDPYPQSLPESERDTRQHHNSSR